MPPAATVKVLQCLGDGGPWDYFVQAIQVHLDVITWFGVEDVLVWPRARLSSESSNSLPKTQE